jgi:hypothetical protein
MIPPARTLHPRVLLRVIAIAIAVAAAIDPAITMSGATRPRLAVVTQQPASAAAERVRARIIQDLGPSHDIVPQVTSDTAAAIVIGDRYPDEPVPEHLLVATVSTAAAPATGVRLVQVDAPRDVPAATTIHLDVDVEAQGLAGRSTDVTVGIGGLEVGRASHLWTIDRERWRAGIDAVPVGEPPWVVRVALAEAPGATAGSRIVSDSVVDLRRSPFRVEVYEPRPSWAATFVRRALESDARFEVASLSSISRGISVRTGDGAPLSDPRLDAADVVVVGGLDRLSAADVRSLDRFMRERGGAVALVYDMRVNAGPVRDLLPIDMTERLVERPEKLSIASGAAPLEASELLLLSNLLPGSLPAGAWATGAGLVIAKTADGSPVIVSMPRGGGRLLVSGAMDAWRFRAAGNNAFDRFWQATLAGLALAAPAPIEISVAPPLLRPFEKGELTVRVRSRARAPIAASIDGDETIRLRPEPEAGLFRGQFTARGTPGRSTIEVHLADSARRSASRTVLVRSEARRIAAQPALSMLASSHRGIDVTADRVEELERFVRGAVTSPNADAVRRPMRSTWWILPLAVCLSAEWWIRRRRGLR